MVSDVYIDFTFEGGGLGCGEAGGSFAEGDTRKRSAAVILIPFLRAES